MAQSAADGEAVPVSGRRDRRSVLPWGVVFSGVDHLPKHCMDKCLRYCYPELRRGPRRWTLLKQGGWHFQHVHAVELLKVETPADMFGPACLYRISRYEGAYIATVFASERVTNEAILDLMPGAFRVRRWKNHRRGMHVHFSTVQALAKAVRDGATISGEYLDFQVAKRRPCPKCFSLEHKFCYNQRCWNCGSPEHTGRECKNDSCCAYCSGEHTSRYCPDLPKALNMFLEQDTARVLGTVPSFHEIRAGRVRDALPSLPPRQMKLCERKSMEPEEFASRSFADVAEGKKKRRRKEHTQEPAKSC